MKVKQSKDLFEDFFDCDGTECPFFSSRGRSESHENRFNTYEKKAEVNTSKKETE